MSYVNDNYGSRWVKGVTNWIRLKTLDGCLYAELIIEGTLYMGLRRNKTIEIINEFAETGLLFFKDAGKTVCWRDINLEPIQNKNVVDEKKTRDMKELLRLYNEYVKSCKTLNESPMTYEEWLERNLS